jgi:MFS superfamily sulfate permease-like transporter
MSAKDTSSATLRTDIPKKGWAGFKENWKADLIAGFSVSLIALPLCLGIAKASEFPAIAGVFTAIIGGLIASRLCGSFVTISGPAAGLIAINVAAVTTLGGIDPDPVTGNAAGYPFALAAIVIAGVLVLLFGLLKVGKLSDFFPSAAVHGMLAAIGLIIIIKQAYPAIGVGAPKGELIEVAAELPKSLLHTNPIIVFIALLSLALLIIYPRIKNKWIKMIPAPMWVLLAAIPLTFAFDLNHAHSYMFSGAEYKLDPMKMLVQLPNKITDGIVFPDFGKFATGAFWMAVMTIALVSGLESLLSAKAVDTLDPWKRKSNLNKDLIALGAGSSAAAAIGGLPMISEIVRSSANINNGARSPWANFFHGGFLLVFLFLLKDVIMDIPNAALAAMLIFTGFRLASPKEFKHMAEIGWKQLLVFVTTIIMVLLIDLLVGIAAGMVMELILNFASGGKLSSLIKAQLDVQTQGKKSLMLVKGSLTYTNYLSLKKQVFKLSASEVVTIDFAKCTLVDHTTLSNLTDMQVDFRAEGRQLVFLNLESMHASNNHPLAPRSAANGTQAVASSLSRRQIEMMNFGLHHQLAYLPEESEGHQDWQGFAATDGKKIERVTNVFVIQSTDNFKLTIADLQVSSGAQLTLETNDTTYLRIDFKTTLIPTFTLSKESGLDRVAERLGAQDIDFSEFPVFSEAFLLQGSDEAGIRNFFTPALLQLLEENSDLMATSRGDAMLFQLGFGLANAAGVDRLLQFGKSFCTLVLNDPKHPAA